MRYRRVSTVGFACLVCFHLGYIVSGWGRRHGAVRGGAGGTDRIVAGLVLYTSILRGLHHLSTYTPA